MATSIPLSQITLPGHRSPGAGFEAPFEMLGACHERVERMLRLLARLQQQLASQGWSPDVAQAAADVTRYFDLAAPLHHEDEERHVFPPLLASGDADLCAVVKRLQQDHRDMATGWVRARAVLASLIHSPAPGRAILTADEAAALHDFSGLYQQHLMDEDALVYPAAQAQLSPQALQTMSADMMRRRGLDPLRAG
jgi:hemerythrin-like domain-containing protein